LQACVRDIKHLVRAMNLSVADWLAFSLKAVWDFLFSGLLFRRAAKGLGGEALTVVARQKRQRDDFANKLAFAALALLSLYSLVIGVRSAEVSVEDAADLNSRVTSLEARLKLVAK
jgi:hypothetical protein